MTLAAYNGHEALTFTDYLDLGTGKTLHAEPGGVYDVAPASGRPVPDIPGAWFTEVKAPSTGSAEVQVETPDAVEAGAAAATGSEEEAGGEPGGEDDHSAF